MDGLCSVLLNYSSVQNKNLYIYFYLLIYPPTPFFFQLSYWGYIGNTLPVYQSQHLGLFGFLLCMTTVAKLIIEVWVIVCF